MQAEQTAQILADADEIEFALAGQYPAGSLGRMALVYCAEILRREFSMTDAEKVDFVLKILERTGPITKTELIERLDFSRDECRRVVETAIRLGVIATVQEATNGRPRILLQIP